MAKKPAKGTNSVLERAFKKINANKENNIPEIK